MAQAPGKGREQARSGWRRIVLPSVFAALEPRSRELVQTLLATPAASLRMAGWSGLRVTPMGGARTARHVLELTEAKTRSSRDAVVIKIVGHEAGRAERHAYDTSVRDLPFDNRPRLLAYAEQGKLAALCLSRVGATNAQTLTQRLQRGDNYAIQAVLDDLIPCFDRSWYAAGKWREGMMLAEHYTGRFFRSSNAIAEAETRLHRYALEFFAARRVSDGLQIGDQVFAAPSAVLFESHPIAGHSCILHGDFNSDNIIIHREEVFAVDFQSTARGHVFEDFVSLEASVRINWPDGDAPGKILETEKYLARGVREFPRGTYASHVVDVRDAALTRFGALDGLANHHFAVAAIGLRLMLANDLPAAAHPRIVASTLWATRSLQRAVRGQANARGRYSSARSGTSTIRPQPALQAQRPLSAP